MKSNTSSSASAPGKLILLGEHAVLQGHPAIVCAVNHFIHVTVTPRSDNAIVIRSNLGMYHTHLEALTPQKPFEFVLTTLHFLRSHLSTGYDIDIKSDFSNTLGFGSSAAVTVALLTALKKSLQLSLDRYTLFLESKQIVQTAQGGVGSGVDLIAAIYGGTIYFNPTTQTIMPLPYHPPLTVVYSGYKTPTPVVIHQVQNHFAHTPHIFATLCQQMGTLVEAAKEAIHQADWHSLGNLMTQGQQIMQALGVSDAHLQYLVAFLNQQPGIFGAKISGSGLGDCVVAIGKTTAFLPEKIDVKIAEN